MFCLVGLTLAPAECLNIITVGCFSSTGSSERLLGIYHSSTVKNTTTLLLSTDADTLFVGAQDALLSLDVSQPDSITLKDKVRKIL